MTRRLTKADGAVFQARPRRLSGAWQASYSVVVLDGRYGPEDSCWTSDTIKFANDRAVTAWLTSEAAGAGFCREEIEWT